MLRSTLAWTAVVVIALCAVTAGCRMCAHPYDDCGPTFTGDCGSCDVDGRRGSILAPSGQVITEMGPEMATETGTTFYEEGPIFEVE